MGNEAFNEQYRPPALSQVASRLGKGGCRRERIPGDEVSGRVCKSHGQSSGLGGES